METKNQYEERAKRTFAFEKGSDKDEEAADQTGNKKDEIIELIKNVALDAGISVIGGGAISAILGRLSLPVGAALTTYAHRKKNNHLRTLGIGIMASSSMNNRVKPKPDATMGENAMERLKAFGEDLKNRLCLDLLTKQKGAEKKETRHENDPQSDLEGSETPKNNKAEHESSPSHSKEQKETPKADVESTYLNIDPGASAGNEPGNTVQGYDVDEPYGFINAKGGLI